MLDYREKIDEHVNNAKKMNSKFNYSFFAEKAGVQNTYFSRVLKLEAHLNSDQIFLLCEALNLKPEEQEYLVLLHEYDRSIVVKRKSLLKTRIKEIEQEFARVEEYLKAEFVTPENHTDLAKYYLNPLNTIIHICLTVPHYNKNPNRIAEALKIEDSALKGALQLLTDLKMIEPADKNSGEGQFRILQSALQLSKTSLYTDPHQTLMRYKSQDRISNLPIEKRKGFAVTFSADPATQKEIHKEFLNFISKIEKLVRNAPAEEVYQLNFDIFPWT